MLLLMAKPWPFPGYLVWQKVPLNSLWSMSVQWKSLEGMGNKIIFLIFCQKGTDQGQNKGHFDIFGGFSAFKNLKKKISG
jgi:hypothetical protein